MKFLNLFEGSKRKNGAGFDFLHVGTAMAASEPRLNLIDPFDRGDLKSGQFANLNCQLWLHCARPHHFLIFDRLCGMRCTLMISCIVRSMPCFELSRCGVSNRWHGVRAQQIRFGLVAEPFRRWTGSNSNRIRKSHGRTLSSSTN